MILSAGDLWRNSAYDDPSEALDQSILIGCWFCLSPCRAKDWVVSNILRSMFGKDGNVLRKTANGTVLEECLGSSSAQETMRHAGRCDAVCIHPWRLMTITKANQKSSKEPLLVKSHAKAAQKNPYRHIHGPLYNFCVSLVFRKNKTTS